MSMRAFVVTSFSGETGMAEIPVPQAQAGEVLIAVAACGLNFADLLMMDGRYQETPALPFVPGMEVAGRIAAVGEGVTSFGVGDRAAAFAGSGGLAEFAVAKAAQCQKLPETMDDVTAAGFMISYGTSHLALTRRAELRAGETLAVLGAAGGVGRTAVEIGHVLGARVIAVARGRERLEVARAAGADVLIDSGAGDLRDALRAHGPVDVVYDAVGGAAGEAAMRALAPEGRHLLIGFASGDVPVLKANHMLVKNIDVIGFYWGGYSRFRPDAVTDSLATLVEWHGAGKIAPLVSEVLPLERASEGLELLRARKATGKIVITL